MHNDWEDRDDQGQSDEIPTRFEFYAIAIVLAISIIVVMLPRIVALIRWALAAPWG